MTLGDFIKGLMWTVIAAKAQDIEVGPVRVDTGVDWLDLLFVLIILLVCGTVYYKWWNKP